MARSAFNREVPLRVIDARFVRFAPRIGKATVKVVGGRHDQRPTSDQQIASGWRVQNGYAITPAINSSLNESWPMNSCGAFDEWYFFRNVPAEIHLEAFCNWGVRAVSDWPDLVACQPNNFNLLAQLRKHEPELVIGEGRFIFVIAKDPKVIQVFRVLAREP